MRRSADKSNLIEVKIGSATEAWLLKKPDIRLEHQLGIFLLYSSDDIRVHLGIEQRKLDLVKNAYEMLGMVMDLPTSQIIEI